MRLSEVQTQHPVRDGGAGSTRQYFRAEDGWSLDFEQGLVTARKGDVHRLIPVANVAWMTPAPKAKT